MASNTSNQTKSAANNDYFIKKNFYTYLIPSIISILGGNISIMIDNCVAGNVMGEQALAAMSIVNPIFNIITAFGLLICGGASILASISIGSNNSDEKYRYFTLAVWLTITSGLLVTIIGIVFLEPIILLLGTSEELFSLVRDYCLVMFCGSLAIMAVYLPLNFFRIEGMARIGMIMFLTMSALNVAFDLIFVVLLQWGMIGLSLATVLSSAIAVISVLPKLMSRKLGYRIVKIKKPFTEIKNLLYKGSPLALGNVYAVIRVRLLNRLLLDCGGSLAIAAYSCANNVNIIGMAFISGIVQTIVPIVGVLYGERDGQGIRNTVKKAVVTAFITTILFTCISIIFSGQLSILFGMTEKLQLQATKQAIIILSVNLIFVMLSSVLIYCYMTCGHTRLANILTFTKGIGFVLPATILGANLFGSSGVLYGLVTAEVATILLSFVVIVVKKLNKSDETGFLLLSHKRFDEGHSVAYSIENTADSITQASNNGGEFCKLHGLSPKQVMAVSLGIEEMMILLSKYALTKEHSKELIELRLFVSNVETIVRIRCAGNWFNPFTFEPDDEFDNMGMKMMLKIAKSISYSTNLGMNNIQMII